MSELKEERDYYDDRSLKSVYFVDKKGRKQGKYTEYKENSKEVLKELEYKDDEVWNGKVDTRDGYIEYRKGEIVEKRDGNVICSIDTNSATVRWVESVCWNSKDEWGHIRTHFGEQTKSALTFEKEGDKIKISGEIDGKKCFATFENGVPVGEYRMPLNMSFSHWAYPSPIEKYLEGLPAHIPSVDGCEVFKSDDKAIRDILRSSRIIAEGVWKDGKFTGIASQEVKQGYGKVALAQKPTEFFAEWIDGKATAEYMFNKKVQYGLRLYHETKSYKWHDGICDVRTSLDEETHEYVLRGGRRDGLYKITYCGETMEESEYKAGKLHGISKKYNKNGWLESETQYKDDKKDGTEKFYNSDETIASTKYYRKGKEISARKYGKEILKRRKAAEMMKRIAAKRIEKEKKIEAKTGEKTRLPKMSKFEKKVAIVKDAMRLSR